MQNMVENSKGMYQHDKMKQVIYTYKDVNIKNDINVFFI